jgi:hypothetical protein
MSVYMRQKVQLPTVFFTIIDKKNFGVVTVSELEKSLEKLKIKVKAKKLEKLADYLGEARINLTKL